MALTVSLVSPERKLWTGTATFVLARTTEGEIGVLAPGAVGDVAVWKLTGPLFAGAIADPVEAWLRCGPAAAWHTLVNGRFVVRDGHVTHAGLPDMLREHAGHAARVQRLG